MDKLVYVSPYKNNLLAKKKRVILFSILQYLLTFIATILFFYLSILGSSYLSVTKDISTNFEQSSLKIKKYINTTHLLSYNFKEDNATSRDIELDARDYVTNLVKTSAYIHDIAYPIEKDDSSFDKDYKLTIEETFLGDLIDYKLDNVSFFFLKFMKEDLDLNQYVKDNILEDKELLDFIYLDGFGYSTKEGFVDNFLTANDPNYLTYKDSISYYQVLTSDNTKTMINRVVYNDVTNDTANRLYTDLSTGYKNAIQTGIDIVEKGSITYSNLSKDFYKYYNQYSVVVLISYLVAYVVGYVILFLFGKGMSKDTIPVSMKSLNLSFARKDEMTPTVKNHIIYHVSTALLYLSNVIVTLFFSGYLGALNLTIFGGVNLFVIALALLILSVISLVFIFFNKNNQTLTMFLSNLVVKDLKEAEQAVLASDKYIENNELTNDGKHE